MSSLPKNPNKSAGLKTENQTKSPKLKKENQTKSTEPKMAKKILRDNIQGITNSAITRLARQAGVVRLNNLVFDEIRGIIKNKLEEILRKAVNLADLFRKRTISMDIVIAVLPFHMFTTSTRYDIFKKPKINGKRGSITLRQIRFYQKQFGTFLLRKSSFARFVHQIGQDFRTDLRYSRFGIKALQTFIEIYIIDLFKKTIKLGINCNRVTIYPKDINIVKQLESKQWLGHITGVPTHNFGIYINKVLKQVHPNNQLSENVKSQINGFINYLGSTLASICFDLTGKVFHKKNTPAVISSRHIQTAVRLILPGELAKHAVREGAKAVARFTLNSEVASNGKKNSRSSKAGLQFPVSVCEKIIRNYGRSVRSCSSVYLSAVLEYITAEILELSGNASRDNKLIKINPRHLFFGVNFDEELSTLFEILNYKIVEGGVIPKIETYYLNKL